MDDFEKELKLGFLEEAGQLLSDVERCYLDLESNPADISIIDQIFRVAHNLKGSSKAVGFDEMGAFAHEFESLLLKLKNQELQPSSELVSLLLRCNDHIAVMVNSLKDDMSSTFDSTGLLQEIEAAMQGKLSQSSDIKSEAEEVAEEAKEEVSTNYPPADAFVEESQDPEAYLQSLIDKNFQEQSTAPTQASPAPSHPEVPTKTQDNVVSLKAKEATAPSKAHPPSGGGGNTSDESIRVSLARLEKLLNYVGEMVILQTVLKEQTHDASLLIRRTVHQLGKVTKEVQDISMGLRMVPLKQTFQKMQRIVRDTSNTLGKKVNLVLAGEDTELDKTVLERISDPLVHLVRNAVDHGVEGPQTRIDSGKDPMGTLLLSAYHQSGKLVIEVKDNGAGINPDVLRRKAVEKGILKSNQNISDKDAINLIFHPGFSTKAQVTDVSGRGVGMDVVKTNIEALQGEVLVETELGVGTTFKIFLPLTLAIIDAMIIKVQSERFVIPLSHVHESVRPVASDIKYTTGIGEVLMLRGENLPLFKLSDLLNRKGATREIKDLIALVVRTGSSPYAVLVDDIIGQHQVVIKQLGEEVQGLKGFAGSAILGDGKPALILEIAELMGRGAKVSGRSELRGVAV